MLTLAEREERDKARKVLRKIGRRERQEAKERRPVNPKADRGRKRDPAYLAWLRRQPCALRGHRDALGKLHICDGPIQAAHVRTHKPGELPTGLQRKPDDERANPLCADAHSLQHHGNEMAFWRFHGLDPFEVAATHFARFVKETQG